MKPYFPVFALLFVLTVADAQQTGSPAAKNRPAPKYLVNGLDPLGRPNYPAVGILPAIGAPDVPPAVVSQLGIAFANGFGTNAHTPFSVVSKDKFDSIRDILPSLSKEEIRKYYYWESVGAEYLVRLDVSRFMVIVENDTLRREPNNPASPIQKLGRVYHMYANLNASVIDVSTSGLLLSNSFSLQSDSRNAVLKPGQTDSTIALIRLYDQIKSKAIEYRPLFAGTGAIDSILEIKKDRAKTVRVNPNFLMNLSEFGSTFLVSTVGESFSAEGKSYRHIEPVGTVYKPRDFRFWDMNFEVTGGEKDILEDFNAGKKLVCSIGPPPLSAKPATDPVISVLVDTFQVKVKGCPGLARLLQEAITDPLSRRTQLISLVNRSSYRDLETERLIQSKTKSDASQAGVTRGADYLLTGEVIEYNLKWENQVKTEIVTQPETPAKAPATPVSTPAAAQKEAGLAGNRAAGKATPPAAEKPKTQSPPAVEKPKVRFTKTSITGVQGTATAKVELRLISVKTGEIVWSKVLNATAMHDFPVMKKSSDKAIWLEGLYTLLADNFAAANINAVALGMMRRLPILKVLEQDEKSVDLLLVGGGAQAGITPYMAIDVIEESVEMVDNQPLKRETVVAELKSDDVFSETSTWKVRKGEKELRERLSAKAKLYCRVR